jgi:(1->4)-alpha-D-glucan 1-alpha-D-glucosylmutase
MALPTATYRVQFRNGMNFARAIDRIPDWLALGISHVYASPIFAATAGSTHGYDIIDPNLVDPAIGGREGFEQFAAALARAGLGLIIDIVPNHLAASLENPWWRSVIELGGDSPYAGHFDIDWNQPLTLPVIAAELDAELAAGAFRLVMETDEAGLSIDYQGSRYPLHPGTYQAALTSLDKPWSGEPVPLHDRRILDLQPWRFIPWREAANGLGYRRFFEVTGLVGVRVEDPDVFEAMHACVLDMVRSGKVQGLRIDHIDGLADPEGYLARLRQAVGPDVYIIVEKILEREEQMRPAWLVAGTTGYEFIASVADLLTRPDTEALDRAYAAVSPQSVDPLAELRQAKEQMIDHNFRGEVSALQRLACDIADLGREDLPHTAIQTALREVLIAFPVYRTYAASELSPEDLHVLTGIFTTLERGDVGVDRRALQFLHAVLKGEVGPAQSEIATRLRIRMQHLTGPLLAKALEDTFFYRYNRLIALNEVGGDPLFRDGSVARFHERMIERSHSQPHGLTTTSTHDTKRGEDARARLYAISEAPALWVEAVERWRAMHRHLVADLAYGPAPEPNLEWLLYQALAGVWPPELDVGNPEQLEALRHRFAEFALKAVREAKQRTDWTDNNQMYEGAVTRYAEALLAGDNSTFLRDFEATIAPFVQAGLHNSMVQTVLKLTAPGIPDIYQGCEGLDFSVVDPDNRRLPDPAAITGNAAAAAKQALTSQILALRQRFPQLFAEGAYIPLAVEGEKKNNVVAYARSHAGKVLVVIVSRWMFDHLQPGMGADVEGWSGTRIRLGDLGEPRAWHDLLGGATVGPTEVLGADAAFAYQPFAIFLSGSSD